MEDGIKNCTKCGEPGIIGTDFSIRKNGKPQSWCRKCTSKAGTVWEGQHPEQRKVHNIKHNYNLGNREYQELLAQQNEMCAICQQPGKQLTVDHCHKSGKVRALLCSGCNSFVGKLETYLDQIDVYLQYIQHHQE